jgi:hypothetical protein
MRERERKEKQRDSSGRYNPYHDIITLERVGGWG